MKTLKIATRKSPLALWQAHHVSKQLQTLYPDLNVELVTIVTKGDKILDTPLAKIGGKGLFIKELEHALLNHEADIAVHSIKDVPMYFPSGLKLAAILERENPSDAFISNQYKNIDDLPQGSIVGTCSLRRQCQLKNYRPDLVFKDLRGNVGTRLNKLDSGEFDAIILASAGLIRLEQSERITQELPKNICLPAVGQGAIGIETRDNDESIESLLTPLQHPLTASCVLAERALNRVLNGGCQAPIAAHAEIEGEHIHLNALVGQFNTSHLITYEASSSIDQAEALGESVAHKLIEQGAHTELEKWRNHAQS